MLQKKYQENPELISMNEIAHAASEGDRLASTVIREAGNHIGRALLSSVSTLNPGLVVIGGPGAKFGNFIVDPIIQCIKQNTLPHIGGSVQVEVSELDDDEASLIGALVLISEKHWAPKINS